MLGYWFIRAYGETGFGESHSVGFGFSGDFYADFGYFGALLACFFLGFGLKRLETYSLHFRKSNQYASVFVAMLYPYVFFSVRDVITSSLTLLLIVAIYLLYGFLFAKQKYRTQGYGGSPVIPVSYR